MVAREATRPVVVFVDQFEELSLQFGEDSAKRKNFPVKLAAALFDPSLRVYFVLSLRSEYFVCLNEFRDAIPTIFHNNANLELHPFDAASARDAIVGPSAREGSGFTWERDLPERIVRDLQAPALNPRANGVPPIALQVVCHTLWSRLPQGRGEITAKSYEAEGGAVAIIERRIFQPLEATPTRFREALLLREETSRGQTWVELRHDYLAARMKPWLDEEEHRLDARRRRNNTLATIACATLAAVCVWLWNDYHTYTAEIGSTQQEPAPEDALVVKSRPPLRMLGVQSDFSFWKFGVETGFFRELLQDGGIRHNTFNVPDAPSDWTAIGEHLAKPARDRLVLATRLDAFFPAGSSRGGTTGALPDFDALECADIGYCAAADDKVLSFAFEALTTGNPKAKGSAAAALGLLKPVASKTQVETTVIRLSHLLAVRSEEGREERIMFAPAQHSIRALTAGDSVRPSEILIQNLESDASRERTVAIHTLPRRSLSPKQLEKIRLLRDDPKRRPWVRMAALDTLMEIKREKDAQARAKKEEEKKAKRAKAPSSGVDEEAL